MSVSSSKESISNDTGTSNDQGEVSKTNLIVNYLPQSMSDEQFRVLFAQYGDIRSARIIRHKSSGQSYGFGFVDYFNTEDAERAIKSLNGHVLNRKTIKVSFARPSSDDIKNANLFVSNLPPDYGEKEVSSLFAKYGEIIHCRLLGRQAGSAFVLFNLHEQAKNALSQLHKHLISGTNNRITVKFASNEVKSHLMDKHKSVNPRSSLSKGSKRPYASSNDEFSLHANGKNNAQKQSGPMRITSHHSARYNPMSPPFFNHQLPPPEMSHFEPPGMYPNSMSYIEEPYYQQHGHYHHPPPPPTCSFDGPIEDEYVLFVYNIGQEDEFSLGKLFSHYGNVLRVNVIRRINSGESRGYGFVTMKYYHEAVTAINALNGHRLAGKPLQVSFKKM